MIRSERLLRSLCIIPIFHDGTTRRTECHSEFEVFFIASPELCLCCGWTFHQATQNKEITKVFFVNYCNLSGVKRLLRVSFTRNRSPKLRQIENIFHRARNHKRRSYDTSQIKGPRNENKSVKEWKSHRMKVEVIKSLFMQAWRKVINAPKKSCAT